MAFNRKAAIAKIADVQAMEATLEEEFKSGTLILGLAEQLFNCKTAAEVAQLRANNVYNRYCTIAIKENKALVGSKYNRWGKLNSEVESLAIAGGWIKPEVDVEEV